MECSISKKDVRSRIGREDQLETMIFGLPTHQRCGEPWPISKKVRRKKKQGRPISKKPSMSDLRSRRNLDLIPEYLDATHLGNAENFVQFQNSAQTARGPCSSHPTKSLRLAGESKFEIKTCKAKITRAKTADFRVWVCTR